MPTARDFGPLDVTDFTVGAMLRAGIAIRRSVRGASSLEEAAALVVRYLYDYRPPKGSLEAELTDYWLKPRDWAEE